MEIDSKRRRKCLVVLFAVIKSIDELLFKNRNRIRIEADVRVGTRENMVGDILPFSMVGRFSGKTYDIL